MEIRLWRECVTSELANSALKTEDGKEILVGNTAADFASHIINLLNNPKFAFDLATSGHQFIHRNYNRAAATSILENLMGRVNN